MDSSITSPGTSPADFAAEVAQFLLADLVERVAKQMASPAAEPAPQATTTRRRSPTERQARLRRIADSGLRVVRDGG